MNIISENDFENLTFKKGKAIYFKGYPSNTVFLFECEEDSNFNVIGFNGKVDNEHFWIMFESNDTGVTVEPDSMSMSSGFTIEDETYNGLPLLNIDAAPEILHDRLVYPIGSGIYCE